MAILQTIFCTSCERSREVMCSVSRYPSVCDECREAQKKEARDKHLSERAVLSVEERLALIEAEMYDKAHAPEPFTIHTPIG